MMICCQQYSKGTFNIKLDCVNTSDLTWSVKLPKTQLCRTGDSLQGDTCENEQVPDLRGFIYFISARA